MAISQNVQDNVTYQGRTFSDLDLNFLQHPATKDGRKKVGENSIKQSIRNLIMTNPRERLFQPEIGCGVYNMLFEPLMPITALEIQESIKDVINSYEPRASNMFCRSASTAPKTFLKICPRIYINKK